MSGSQIRTQLSKIIDIMVEDRIDSLAAEIGQEEVENMSYDRGEAVDALIRIIEFYREDL